MKPNFYEWRQTARGYLAPNLADPEALDLMKSAGAFLVPTLVVRAWRDGQCGKS
jgi:hypothetical protein